MGASSEGSGEVCGINGLFAYSGVAPPGRHRELLATREHMAARGPDGAGAWWDETDRLGLAHRRLAIIDLDDRALQPMASGCGRYRITFNGEIYNYRELRRELEGQGCRFVTSSDTEVLLHLFARRGAAMVHALRGMFAFAIWDETARSLFLARDPYGIKPLYIVDDGWTFRFASQVRALLAGGGVSHDPEPAGLTGFYLWGSVPEPFTLYRDIRALPPGHSMIVSTAGVSEPACFASVSHAFGAADADRADAPDRIQTALRDSVAAHLVADVEVGLFLSAGIDSGALLGLMRDCGASRVRALTIGFEEFSGTQDDETLLAGEVARRFGADHTVHTVSAAAFEADLPVILAAMDQPSIDGINSWFVCKVAHEAGLKVVLSGLGGDELLAGYPSFRDIPRWVGVLGVPGRVPLLGRLLRGALRRTALAETRPKLPGMLEYGHSYAGAYLLRRGLFMPWELDELLDPAVLAVGLRKLETIASLQRKLPTGRARNFGVRPAARVGALESTMYLRNQLLRDADWTSMAHGLELRTPLVDWRLLQDIAPLLPALRPGEGKRLLATAPSQPLPAAVIDRPKTGFNVPVGAWQARLDQPGAARSSAANRSLASRQHARNLIRHFADPQGAPQDLSKVQGGKSVFEAGGNTC